MPMADNASEPGAASREPSRQEGASQEAGTAAEPRAEAPQSPQGRSAMDSGTKAAPAEAGAWQGIGRQLLSLLLWVALALVLRLLVVEPRWIPSGSMLPTLQLQDRILVEKLRPRLGSELRPGTVVVFHPPAALVAAGYDPQAALIKRVVAGAGQTVAVREGRLLRDGRPLDPDWSPERIAYELPLQTVPQEALWVMGDNRNASLDSHVWGPLPQREVIGTAIWRYWPLNRFGPIRFSPTPPPGSS